MISQDRGNGWLKFSGFEELSLGGGGGLDSATLFNLGMARGRIVLDSIELECSAGTNLRLTLTGPGTNIQTIRIVGPGERFAGQGEGIAVAKQTDNVAVIAFLIGAGTSSGFVRVAGKVI